MGGSFPGISGAYTQVGIRHQQGAGLRPVRSSSRMGKWRRTEREGLKHKFAGPCMSVEDALGLLDLDGDYDGADDQLLDGAEGVELCAGCDWWHWWHELTFNESDGRSLTIEGMDT